MSGRIVSTIPPGSRCSTVIVLALCLDLTSPAAEIQPQPPQTPAVVEFRQRVFSREHGLPDNRVLSLLQSRDGYLWIGTGSGVARYDGLRFDVFGPDTHPEFVNDECAALAEGVDGSIWIGTKDGLLRLQSGRIQRFTEQDGLADRRIHSLCAAHNGDVWIGTGHGLNRLRGGRMEAMLPPTDSKPEERSVKGLYEDASGAVWMVFGVTVKRWEPQTDQISPIAIPGTGGVGLITGDQAGHALCTRRPCTGGVGFITGDQDTNIWLKGSDLIHWQNGNPTYSLHVGGEAAFCRARDGSLWFDRKVGVQTQDERGLFRYRDGTLEYYEQADGLSDNRVTALLEDQRGNLWIGTYAGGLNCWQPRRFPTIGTAQGLANEKMWTLAPARDGNLWIGTDEGVCHSREGQFKPSPFFLARLEDGRIRALHEAADGTLWICTGNALEAWDGFRFTPHRWLNQPGGDKYRAVTSDREGVVWMGGESGLMRWRDGQWRQFTTADGLPHNDVYVINEDPTGRFWIGTYGGGVSWLGEARLAATDTETVSNLCVLKLNTTHGLSHDEVRSLHADSDGFLWVGTERGLNRVDVRGLPAERRSPIRRDPSSDSQRAGSETGAPPSLSSGDEASPPPLPPIHSYTRRDGLYDDLVSEILEDDFGNLWITCSRGIYRVSKRELHELAARRERGAHLGAPASLPPRSKISSTQSAGSETGAPSVPGLHCIVYDEGDGLLSTDISGQKSRPAGCKTPDGRLWFPNAKGVVCVDPRRVIAGDIPPPVVIEHFRVDGEDCAGKDFTPPASVAATRQSAANSTLDGQRRSPETPLRQGTNAALDSASLALAPGRARSLEIQYTAPTFNSPERVRFRYRLEGLEKDWVDAGNRRLALYTNLKPGAYRFHVQAASNVGLWNETGDAIAFSIAPHFYERAWFWPALVLLGLGLVGAAVEWRLREVRRIDELSKQAALAGERERIACDMHDDLGAGLTRLILLGGKAAHRTSEADTRTVLGRLTGEAASLVDQLGDLIWCTNHRFDTLDNLLAHLREHAAKFLGDAGLSVHCQEPKTPPALPVTGYFRRQTLLMFKEVLTNIVRHARATHARVSLQLPAPALDGVETLELEIIDDGCGFHPEQAAHGHGLANLRARAAALQGRLEIKSAPGRGTTTRITLPLAPHLKGEGLSGE